MNKKFVFAIFTVLMTFGTASPKSNVEFDVYGNVQLGYWWTREYFFLNDSLMTENGIIMTKDPFPIDFSDIIPGGNLGVDIAKNNLHFLFELSSKRCVYNFKFRYSPTSGYYFFLSNSYLAHLSKLASEWNINDNFSLLIGITRVPCNFSTSNQMLFGGNGFSNSGVLDAGSNSMIQLSTKFDLFSELHLNAKLAAMRVDTTTVLIPCLKTKDTVVTDPSGNQVPKTKILHYKSVIHSDQQYKIEISMPKIESSLSLKFNPGAFEYNLQLVGGFQDYYMLHTYLPLEDLDKQEDAKALVRSYVAGVSTDFKIGPVTLSYTCSGGQNLGIYGVNIGKVFKYTNQTDPELANAFFPWQGSFEQEVSDGSVVDPSVVKNFKPLENSHAIEMAAIGKVQPFNFLSIEGGYGIVKVNHENKAQQAYWVDSHAWYGQIQWIIADVLTLTPEIGYYYYGPQCKQGSYTYGGLNAGFKF